MGWGCLPPLLATAASFRKYASPSVAEPTDAPYEGTDEQLLEEIQRASFGFCTYNAEAPPSRQRQALSAEERKDAGRPTFVGINAVAAGARYIVPLQERRAGCRRYVGVNGWRDTEQPECNTEDKEVEHRGRREVKTKRRDSGKVGGRVKQGSGELARMGNAKSIQATLGGVQFRKAAAFLFHQVILRTADLFGCFKNAFPVRAAFPK